MRTFQPLPELHAFYDALVTKAHYADAFSENATPAHRTLPAIPTRPADVQQAAFFDHLCMPLYGLIKNAYDRINAVTTPAAPVATEVLVYMQQGMTQTEAEMRANEVATMSAP